MFLSIKKNEKICICISESTFHLNQRDQIIPSLFYIYIYIPFDCIAKGITFIIFSSKSYSQSPFYIASHERFL